MFGLLKNHVCPIGVDVGADRVKLVQLENSGKAIALAAGGSRDRPEQIQPGSSQWQKWVIDAINELILGGGFSGRDVVASVPADEVFIDHLKMPKAEKGKIEQALIESVKQRLGFDPTDAMVRHIATEEGNVMLIVMDREKIDRHLAVYEQVNLNVRWLGVWPMVLTKTYTKFFGRRKTDLDAVVLILDLEPAYCNVLICRHQNPLFAKSIPIGVTDFKDDEAVKRFILEVTGCRRHFSSMYKKTQVERLLFLASDGGSVGAQSTYATIARQMELPAQMANCLAAVEISGQSPQIERRDCNFSWAMPFGLSLLLSN